MCKNRLFKGVLLYFCVFTLFFTLNYGIFKPQKVKASVGSLILSDYSNTPELLKSLVVGVAAILYYNGTVDNVETTKYIGDQVIAKFTELGGNIADVYHDTTVTMSQTLKDAMTWVFTNINHNSVSVSNVVNVWTGNVNSNNIMWTFPSVVDVPLNTTSYFRITSAPNTFVLGGTLPWSINIQDSSNVNVWSCSTSTVIDSSFILSSDGSTIDIPIMPVTEGNQHLYRFIASGTTAFLYSLDVLVSGGEIINTGVSIGGIANGETALSNDVDNNVATGSSVTLANDVNLSGTSMADIDNIVKTSTSNIVSTLTNVVDAIKNLPRLIASAISYLFATIVTAITSLGVTLWTWLSNILSAVNTLASTLWGWLQDIIDSVLSLPASIASALSALFEALKTAILSIPLTIADFIRGVLTDLFVPTISIADEFNDLRNDVLPVYPDLSDLNNLNGSGSLPDLFATVTIAGTSLYAKIYDFSGIRNYVDTFRAWCSGIVFIFLGIYNFNQVLWIIRGTSPIVTSRTTTIIGNYGGKKE